MGDDDNRAEAIKEMMGIGHEMGQDFLSDADFARYYRNTVKTAKRQFEAAGGLSHMMYCHLRKPGSDDWQLVGLPLNDMPAADRFAYCRYLGAGVARNFPDYMLLLVTHVSEGWAAPDTTMGKRPDPRYLPADTPMPSQNPERYEVIVASAMSIDLRQSYSSFEIVRDKRGRFERWGKRGFRNEYQPGETSPDPSKSGDFLVASLLHGWVNARPEWSES